MQNDIRELIEALKHCADPNGLCNDCVLFDPKDDDCKCSAKLKLDTAEVIEQMLSLIVSKDIIIDDLNDQINKLAKENEVLWKKHTPIPAAVKVIDEEFDIKIEHCPVCGARILIEDHLYCCKCGQALIVGANTRPSDDTEIGMIANINDRM